MVPIGFLDVPYYFTGQELGGYSAVLISFKFYSRHQQETTGLELKYNQERMAHIS